MWRLLLAFLVASRAFAAGDVAVDAVRRGSAIEISAHADLDTDARTAWQVLTDYDHYATFIPDLAVSRVVARDAGTAIVEQKGEARFLFFRYPLEVQLEVAEVPFRSVRSQAIGGNLRELRGRYEIEPLAGGIRLNYVGRMVLAEEPPRPWDLAAARLAIARQFEALVREIDRRSALGGGRMHREEGSVAPGKS